MKNKQQKQKNENITKSSALTDQGGGAVQSTPFGGARREARPPPQEEEKIKREKQNQNKLPRCTRMICRGENTPSSALAFSSTPCNGCQRDKAKRQQIRIRYT